MADKTIGELTAATKITDSDLFVLEQSSEAKSLSGATLLDYLVTPVTEKVDMHGGIKTIVQNADYTLTITFADGETFTTTDVRGKQGETGPQGRSVTSISKTKTVGLEDTYTIKYSSGSDSTFTVTNGSEIESINLTDTNGLEDTYTVTLTNGNETEFYVTNGNGIKDIVCSTTTPGQADTTDTYTITFDDGKTFSFPVKNGKNGTGSVTSVNGLDGTIVLTGENIDVSSADTTKVSTIAGTVSTLSESVEALETDVANKQPETSTLSTMTALADGDSFPIYDESDKSNKRMLWSNMVTSIVTKIRSAFRTTALSVDSGGTGASTAADARTNLGITISNIGAASAEHTHDAANITSGTLDAERVPAIDGSKITDKTVTRAKLADDARGHMFIDWGVGYDPFTLDHNGETVTVWMSDESASVSREFTSSVANSLPNGYCVTLKKVDAQTDKTYTVTYPNVQIMNFIDRTWTTGGSVTLKNMGDYVTFIKNDSGNWTIDGNLRSPHITSGTADPSGGSDGDIYLQYEA